MATKMTFVGKWEGGRIALLSGGRRRWYLERRWHGRQMALSLSGVRDDRGAMARLVAFQHDPAGFMERYRDRRRRERGLVHDAVVLNQEHLDGLKVEQLRRELAPRYIHSCQKHGIEWVRHLAGSDLRELGRLEVQKLLQKHDGSNQHKRVLALKALCRYLVDTGLLDPALNPARHVRMPSQRPEKSVKPKAADAASLPACYRHIPSQDVQDVFRIRLETGMHGSEIDRIAASFIAKVPLARLDPVDGAEEIAGVVLFIHKGCHQHRISLGAAAWAAAFRLQRLGKGPRQDRIGRQLKVASERAGLGSDFVRAGSLRHAFVSHGQRGRLAYVTGTGVSVEELVEVTGHKSSRTTRRHYDEALAPRRLILPFELSWSTPTTRPDRGGWSTSTSPG